MKPATALSSFLLLASSVLTAAAPRGQSQPLSGLDQQRAAARIRAFREARLASKSNHTAPDATSEAVQSPNWGGVQQTNTGVTGVRGTLKVPHVAFPSNLEFTPSAEYYGCAWVGIDGWNNCGGLQQAGAYWEASGGGYFDYYAFYEWYPGQVYFFDMTISVGDELEIIVTAESTTKGRFIIYDKTTSSGLGTELSNQHPLCQQYAEWIVEDNVPSEMPFPDFGHVLFTDASYTANGQNLGVSGADVFTVNNNNIRWTKCHTHGESTVRCRYRD